ncbi:unnamed protein product [Callosobruchus maculatus]|uniref:Uncharacterized protein n=1 Tax=Callosobruchus maculatus TaxID=64391 RepID=A0A653BS59_CALMS|nr:unnamed protein product [Callosobruchus maculatus]
MVSGDVTSIFRHTISFFFQKYPIILMRSTRAVAEAWYTEKNLSLCQRLTLGFSGTLHSAFFKYSHVLYNGKCIVGNELYRIVDSTTRCHWIPMNNSIAACR